MRNTQSILVGKPEDKRRFGTPELIRENNIKMDLSKTGCEDLKWIPMAKYKCQWWAIVNTEINLRVP